MTAEDRFFDEVHRLLPPTYRMAWGHVAWLHATHLAIWNEKDGIPQFETLWNITDSDNIEDAERIVNLSHAAIEKKSE